MFQGSDLGSNGLPKQLTLAQFVRLLVWLEVHWGIIIRIVDLGALIVVLDELRKLRLIHLNLMVTAIIKWHFLRVYCVPVELKRSL